MFKTYKYITSHYHYYCVIMVDYGTIFYVWPDTHLAGVLFNVVVSALIPRTSLKIFLRYLKIASCKVRCVKIFVQDLFRKINISYRLLISHFTSGVLDPTLSDNPTTRRLSAQSGPHFTERSNALQQREEEGLLNGVKAEDKEIEIENMYVYDKEINTLNVK